MSHRLLVGTPFKKNSIFQPSEKETFLHRPVPFTVFAKLLGIMVKPDKLRGGGEQSEGDPLPSGNLRTIVAYAKAEISGEDKRCSH